MQDRSFIAGIILVFLLAAFSMNAMAAEKNDDGELAALRKNLSQEPTSAVLRLTYAQALTAAGFPRLALPEFIEAARAEDQPAWLMGAATALNKSRQVEEARRYMEAFIDHFPTNPSVFIAIMRDLEWTKPEPRWRFNQFYFPEARPWYQKAVEQCERVIASDAKNYVKARARFEKIGYEDYITPETIEHTNNVIEQYSKLANSSDPSPKIVQRARQTIAQKKKERFILAQNRYHHLQMKAAREPDRETLIAQARAAIDLLRFLPDVKDKKDEAKLPMAAPLSILNPATLRSWVDRHPDDRQGRELLARWLRATAPYSDAMPEKEAKALLERQ